MKTFLLTFVVLFSSFVFQGIQDSYAFNLKNKYGIDKIVIDAGHGGHDSGCLGKSSQEKHLALAIALKMGAYVEEAFPDVEVIYTRKTDVFIPLHERAEIANKNKADLFISIHCNANNNHTVYGTETYVMGLHRTEQNLDVAKRENEAILLEDNYDEHYDGFDPNSPEGHIIFSLYQNAYLDQSISFASKIEEQFRERALRKSRGVKQAGFLVLYKTAMPSVLVESGFLTNNTEENYLRTEDGQAFIASAIYRAFKDYKHEMEAKSADAEVEAVPAVSENTPDSYKEEVTFKVQIFATSKKLPAKDSRISGFDDVLIETTEHGIHKYMVGTYNDYEDAIRYQDKLKKKGYKDAFVVAVKNGQRVPLKNVPQTHEN